MKLQDVETCQIPFAGYVAAGFPSPASDYTEENIDLAKELVPRPLSTFCFRAVNDSMIEAHIPPGAILVVDKSITPRNHAIVIASVNGEFLVKYFVRNREGIRLLPANKKYKPIPIGEGCDFAVWGVVTYIIIKPG